MSLTSALNYAFSGLRSNSLAAALVSTNISNATTESYGKRDLILNSGHGGGVWIDGVSRLIDPALVTDRRQSDAELAYSQNMFSFVKNLEESMGTSGEPGSFIYRIEAFENALVSASSNPASTQRLDVVASSAEDLAKSLNSLSAQVQDVRSKADGTIAAQVKQINSAMLHLEHMNKVLGRERSTGSELTNVLDERDKLIDSVAHIVPLRVIEGEKGQVTIYSKGGAILLEGSASEIGFSPSAVVRPGDSLAGGQLSGLTLNGISAHGDYFTGGSLQAQFDIRDSEAVTRQAELDAIARDLIERLGAGGPDASLASGDPGLFTDAGNAFDPLNEQGLSERIALNTIVSPGSGGAWRLRDGLGATVSGEVGNSSLILALSEALGAPKLPGSSALSPVERSFGMHASEVVSSLAGTRVRAENEQSFQAARNTGLKETLLARGVDTDLELQRLLQVEQLYTANAKVMTTVDAMYERLLQI